MYLRGSSNERHAVLGIVLLPLSGWRESFRKVESMAMQIAIDLGRLLLGL
jgi:hypothetical protein